MVGLLVKLAILFGVVFGVAYALTKFDKDLTFQSSDGVLSVLRLREFAERLMGQR